MISKTSIETKLRKLRLFEYFVIKLAEWKNEITPNSNTRFTKLQLHKLLFLSAASNDNEEKHLMFDIFDNFYALQYGPVEMDIYRAMSDVGQFSILEFNNRDCIIEKGNYTTNEISKDDKEIIDGAIRSLRKRNQNYVIMSGFQLVNITHGWTVWQVSMELANLLGNKMERMSISDIINSKTKTF